MLEKTKLMKLKDKVQLLEADHPDILDENDEFPSGTDITLQGTGDLKMKVDVGGNSTQQTYEGYNLLPYTENFTETKNGVTFEGSNGVYKISGNPSNSNFTSDISLLENYTIQENDYLHYGNNKLNANISVRIIFSDNTNDTTGMTPINRIFSLANYVGKTITKIGFYNSANYSGEEIIIKPMILNNVSTVTDFEKYVGGTASPNPIYKQDINNVEGDVEVKGSSKNLFDKDSEELTTNAGKYHMGGNVNANPAYTFLLMKNIKENSYYTYSGCYNNHDVTVFDFYNGDERINHVYPGTESGTIQTPANCDRMYVSIRIDDVDTFQLEKGSTATPYVPHAENSVTFPLSQGQKLMLGDTLEDDGIHHKREHKRINSTNFNIVMSVNNKVCYIKNLDYSNFYNTSGLCTHFTNANVSYLPDNNAAEQNLNDNQFNFRTGTIDRVYFKNSNFTSLADWTNFFNNNEVYLEYELAEETIDPYTQAQQTAYNKLKEMQSYYDLTYVVGSSDNAQPILTAHAKKSIKTIGSEDLTDYVKNTDYATSSTGGVIKTASASATDISSGILQASTKTYSDYTSGQNTMFIGKGTLENVITGKGLTNVAHTNSNNNFSTAQTINGTLTVVGDISQTGTTYETHAEQLYTAKDIIKTRDGAVGGLGNNEVTGIEAIKYDGTNNGRLIFDNTGTAKVGDVGDEVPLLARDESTNMTNNYVMTWDSTNLIAKTSFGVVTLTQSQYDALVSSGTVDSNTFYYTTEDIPE